MFIDTHPLNAPLLANQLFADLNTARQLFQQKREAFQRLSLNNGHSVLEWEKESRAPKLLGKSFKTVTSVYKVSETKCKLRCDSV